MRGGPFSAPGAAKHQRRGVGGALGGAIRITRLALPLLTVAPESAVVFVSSAVALAAVPQLAVYAATKAGVHSLARSLRAELSGTSVGVFEALLPVVDTELARHLDVAKVPASTVAEAIIAGNKPRQEAGRHRSSAATPRHRPGRTTHRRRHRATSAATNTPDNHSHGMTRAALNRPHDTVLAERPASRAPGNHAPRHPKRRSRRQP